MKYFCPTDYDEGIFNAVTQLLSEKIEQAKCLGFSDAKTINTIECENFCNFFKIPEQLYNAVLTQVVRESTPITLGNDSNWLPSRYTPSDYLNSGIDSSQVFTIN